MSEGFRCPVTQEPIVATCGLPNCRYHVDYPWSRNCLLVYMHEQGVETLSTDEIAFLYRRPPGRVKKALESAFVKLRGGAIKSAMPREFTVIATDGVCCVCESAVEDVARNLRLARNVYCSRECRDERPPAVMELEIRHGLPIAKILEWTFRHYRTTPLAEQALQIPRWMLQDVTTKYLDKPLDHFFETVERRSIVRRTWHAPEWVDAMIGRVRRQMKAAERFGPVTFDVAAIRQRITDVIG